MQNYKLNTQHTHCELKELLNVNYGWSVDLPLMYRQIENPLYTGILSKPDILSGTVDVRF